MSRIKREREDLVWNPELKDFYESFGSSAKDKVAKISWYKALKKKMSPFIKPG